MGVFPGPAGEVKGFRRADGFDLGTDWADYSKDITNEENWTSTGQILEMVVTTTPEQMQDAVLTGLRSLNASIAAIAREYPSK